MKKIRSNIQDVIRIRKSDKLKKSDKGVANSVKPAQSSKKPIKTLKLIKPDVVGKLNKVKEFTRSKDPSKAKQASAAVRRSAGGSSGKAVVTPESSSKNSIPKKKAITSWIGILTSDTDETPDIVSNAPLNLDHDSLGNNTESEDKGTTLIPRMGGYSKPAHPFIVPILTFLVLFFATMFGIIFLGGETMGASDSRVVRVTIDGQEKVMPTRAETVGELVERLDMQLTDADIITPDASTLILEDNMKIAIQKARPVTISDQGRSFTVLSAHEQPRNVVENAGIELQPEDGVVVDSSIDTNSTPLSSGSPIIGDILVVERAQEVRINLYGSEFAIKSRAKTVGELLKSKDIKIVDGDSVVPAKDTSVTAGMRIFVVRKGSTIATLEESIPAPQETIEDKNLEMGKKEIRQEGSDGLRVVTYEIIKDKEGNETGRNVLNEVIIRQPVKRIEARGTKSAAPSGNVTGSKLEWMAAAGISPSDYDAVDFIIRGESTWNPGAVNPSRCIGLGQRCNASILIEACPSWQTDPVCQLQHFSQYADGRYGGWQGAYEFWVNNRWW